jgi:hypothetical protein
MLNHAADHHLMELSDRISAPRRKRVKSFIPNLLEPQAMLA